MADKAKDEKQKYRVTGGGINYPGVRGEKRANHGAIVDDIPPSSIPWLLRQGEIEIYDEEAEAKKAEKEEKEGEKGKEGGGK